MYWLKKWQWFSKADTLQLFLYLLVNANTEDRYWQGILIKRGQIVTTIPLLAKVLDSTNKKVRNNLERLSMSSEIGRQRTNKYSIITICDYDSYIGLEIDKGQSTGSQRVDKGQSSKEKRKENIPPTPPIKENKKEKNFPPIILADDAPPKKTPKEIYLEVVELWHSICTDYPKLRTHSQSRQNKVYVRLTEMGGYSNALVTITEIFHKAQESNFLRGDNRNNWKANFDWFFENSNNWCKVIEGVYDNRHGQSTNNKERIIRERQEQHLRDIERLNAEYLAKIKENSG